MNGLINRSVQCFVRDTYGEETWRVITRALGVGADGYEMLLDYPDDETDQLVAIAAAELGKDQQTFLEDLGTYLVSHETTRPIRRLLRFCGETFAELLHALHDLPSRAQLAMPGLVIPELEVREDQPGQFRIFVLADRQGWGDVLIGLLRAMADDYGALVLMERGAGSGAIAVIEVKLLDGRFAEGRDFALIEDGPAAATATEPHAADTVFASHTGAVTSPGSTQARQVPGLRPATTPVARPPEAPWEAGK
ncbi:MAG: heme NO-binding domain-containing protein [Pseudomonadota bacterium]